MSIKDIPKKLMPKAADLKRMRVDAGLEQTDLAYSLYKDPKKNQRIGKIERGEVEPTLREGLQWYFYCARDVDRQEIVLDAVERLQDKSSKKSKPH